MKPAKQSKELVAASSRPMVLSVLARGENYGYAILKEVKRLSGGIIDWKEGMLYPVLHRLEAEGLIEASWRNAGGRKRKYYALTDAGQRALASERAAWESVNATLNNAWGLNT